MKRIFNLLLFVLCFSSINAAVENKAFSVNDFNTEPEVQALSSDMTKMAIDEFLAFFPSDGLPSVFNFAF